MASDPIRHAAVQAITQVLKEGCQPKHALESGGLAIHAAVQEKLYGVLRHYWVLHTYLSDLLARPFKAKDTDLWAIVLLGAYELYQGEAPYAVVDQAVRQVPRHKSWAKAVINGVLRRWIREWSALHSRYADHPRVRTGLPDWLQPVYAGLTPFFQAPPMGLRIHTHRISRADYQAALEAQGCHAYPIPGIPQGLYLERPVPVQQLPGWDAGWVAVQDGAAQWAAWAIPWEPGQRVLDACAAPGGKTGALINRCPELVVTAVECAPQRMERLIENMIRWGWQDRVERITGEIQTWAAAYTGPRFDRIVLDVPCSALGIIRRHPDLLQKTPEAFAHLPALQKELLQAVWPLLQPGGLLLYVTCSIMPIENDQVVGSFVTDWSRDLPGGPVVETIPAGDLPPEAYHYTRWGMQFMPQGPFDGLYYACLRKPGFDA